MKNYKLKEGPMKQKMLEKLYNLLAMERGRADQYREKAEADWMVHKQEGVVNGIMEGIMEVQSVMIEKEV